MSATLEQVMTELASITDLVKNHKHDGATLDMPALELAVKGIMERQQLIRRGDPGEQFIGIDGRSYTDPIVRGGKFDGCRKSDLQFAVGFLARAASMGVGRVTPASQELVKAAMNTTDSTGGDLVPTNLAAEIWSDTFLASRVMNAFGSPIAMPSDPFEIPLTLGNIVFYKGTQNTVTTATVPATDKDVMTTTELVAEVDWSYTLDEDSVIAMLPSLRARLGMAAAEYMDSFILNADSETGASGNINLDDAAPSAALHYMSAGQLGIRHLWLGDATGQGVNAGGDVLEDADIVSAMALMGKYAVNPGRVAMFTDISTYLKGFLNLDSVQTLDKYGGRAVLLSGELSNYRGVPIIISASHPLAEADGKVSTTPGNNTLGSISLVNLDQWRVGFKRQMLIEVDKLIQYRSFILVASFRIAVAAGVTSTRSAVTHTAGIRNILVA
jgi:hypothetical protein